MKAVDVGAKIAERRKELGMTQVQLAEKLYVTNKAVSKWENGINFPDLSLMESIASALDMSVVELLGLEEKTVEEAVLATADLSNDEKKRLHKKIKEDVFITILFGAVMLVLSFYVDAKIPSLYGVSSAVAFIKYASIAIVASGIRTAIRFRLGNKEILSEKTVKIIRRARKTMLVISICAILAMILCAIYILYLFGVFG